MTRNESVGFRLGMIGLVVSSFLGASQGARAAPIGEFRNTYYYLIFESEYPDEPKSESLLTTDGRLITKVTKRFYKDLVMEGSGKLRDGRIANWAAKVDGTSRFHVTRHLWGRGVGNCPLVPLRTIAADPTQIPQGAVVKIDETVGMRLPDGTIHNGVWRAEDVGSAILRDRIDLFVGKKQYAKALSEHGITHLQPLTIHLLELPAADACVYQVPERDDDS
jgi:3D (Asp-Asp-Asp) domain-containing protein